MSAVLARLRPANVIKDFSRVKELRLARHHAVALGDIKSENLQRILEKTYEKKPDNFEALLGVEGVGPKTIRALSLISELVYGKPASFRDPVRFSFTHGGKDGHPYPVDKQQYDLSIQILGEAIRQARLGRSEKIAALKRLSFKTGIFLRKERL
jgi:hypothetical protein